MRVSFEVQKKRENVETNLNEDVESTTPREEISGSEVESDFLHEVSDDDTS